ncbi:MAG: hypothetical protein RRA63_02330 [Candidatus Calescibacterium sp.]|jgi:hypothetical protein|nr:hypothetical protein [Candidatus Calescibacterium sp.]
MPAGFLVFVLIMESTGDLGEKYKYTVSINPTSVLPFMLSDSGFSILQLHPGRKLVVVPSPGINFEVKIIGKVSINFEINNMTFFGSIIPAELELGIREYLQEGKKFYGLYIYQGLSWGIVNFYTRVENFERTTKYVYVPNLILLCGYKYISGSGFTIDPFLGSRIVYGLGYGLGFGKVDFFPAIGVYLGYSWNY